MSEPCPLGWCERVADHDEMHQATIATATGERGAAVAVTVEASADDGRNPTPVISVEHGDTVADVFLAWDQLHELATAAIAAYRTYAREAAS